VPGGESGFKGGKSKRNEILKISKRGSQKHRFLGGADFGAARASAQSKEM